MLKDATSQSFTDNVIPLITVVDVRLKIVEALGAGALDFDFAQKVDAETKRASAADLRAAFDRLESLIAAKTP